MVSRSLCNRPEESPSGRSTTPHPPPVNTKARPASEIVTPATVLIAPPRTGVPTSPHPACALQLSTS